MWKTFADDCQFFDVFAAFVLSFIGFNFYFCLTASEEKKKTWFSENRHSEYFHNRVLTNRLKRQNYGDF